MAEQTAPPAADLPPPPESPIGWLRENGGWIAIGLSVLVLLYFLGPILTPFVIGAGIAYLGDPLVDRLETLRIPRMLGTAIVFAVLFGGLVLGLILLVPVLQQQVLTFAHNVPEWLRWLQEVGLPRMGVRLPAGVRLDVEGLRNVLTRNWSEAGDVATTVLGRVGHSTPALLAFLANLLLVPIALFYLLRDCDLMVARIRDLIPRRLLPQTLNFARETNAMLNALIRGQLMVMAALALVYSLGLYFAGLNLALLIGIVAGLISFIPYLGLTAGLLASSIAMLVQTEDLVSLWKIGAAFGVGQILEQGVLVPLLVGDRIGLHPVAVIFAVLAGGQLFGFIGVLLALPVAAVVAVLLRHARRQWLRSPLYLRSTAPPDA
jgi:predicted PurR-regulated permease PerM